MNTFGIPFDIPPIYLQPRLPAGPTPDIHVRWSLDSQGKRVYQFIPERAFWRGQPDHKRIRQINHDFPRIGPWIYRRDPRTGSAIARHDLRWQFVGRR